MCLLNAKGRSGRKAIRVFMIWLIRIGLLVLGFLFTAPLVFEPSTPQTWSIIVLCDLGFIALWELARVYYEGRSLGKMNVRKRPFFVFILHTLIGLSGLAIAVTHLVVHEYKIALYGLLIALIIIPGAFKARPF
ncbi:MAG: hypothetical protein EOM08_13185 [Clostridia bacterium]|nr:hypothetical protein [Clostridia bacterium]